jgi:hypothetical protein
MAFLQNLMLTMSNEQAGKVKVMAITAGCKPVPAIVKADSRLVRRRQPTRLPLSIADYQKPIGG